MELESPETQLTADLVFNDDATATAALMNIYNDMCKSSWLTADLGSPSISVIMGVYADELKFFYSGTAASGMNTYYTNNLLASDGAVQSIWGQAYNYVYQANRVLDGLNKSTGVSDNTKDRLRGEALFLRSFCHFYLLQLFGHIPYITAYGYTENVRKAAAEPEEVYNGIIADLLEAKGLLSDSYPSSNRVRANKGACIALLARVYLYHQKWAQAETQATELINKTNQYHLLNDLNEVFLKNSSEAIWQIIPNGTEATTSTSEGRYFILLATPTGKSALTDQLWNAFEPGDQRQMNWTDTLTEGLSRWYFPYKYKRGYGVTGNTTEYTMVLRLAEQYLIRAEARAMQNKLSEAALDINSVRHRAGLMNDVPAISQDQLITAIEQERKVELFTEWGHRFFDLKRWSRLDAALGPVKPGWNSTDSLLPIPQSEILANSNLRQNEGY